MEIQIGVNKVVSCISYSACANLPEDCFSCLLDVRKNREE
jgi:hypothetical protein